MGAIDRERPMCQIDLVHENENPFYREAAFHSTDEPVHNLVDELQALAFGQCSLERRFLAIPEAELGSRNRFVRKRRPGTHCRFYGSRPPIARTSLAMTHTLEISDELKERLDRHLEEGETHEELIAELLSMYETEGAFLQEGYSE